MTRLALKRRAQYCTFLNFRKTDVYYWVLLLLVLLLLLLVVVVVVAAAVVVVVFYIHVTVRRYRFIFNNQTRRTIYPNLFCYKTLHVSGNFFAHHQESPTVHSALVHFMHVVITASKQSQGGTAVPS